MHLLFDQCYSSLLFNFIKFFLLESNSTSMRWKAHELLHTVFKYVRTRLMTMSLLFPVLFGLMMALHSTETRNIALKNLALFRPKLCDFYGTSQIVRFVNYYCYRVNVIEFSIRLKN